MKVSRWKGEPMSQWKWNDVELEIDMEDYDFLKKYEDAFRHMEVTE